ncbi:glycoside hydrolase family 9 protein, partial [Peniophora sp. CONT]
PNPQWSNLLGDLLYFYEAQRSGTLPSTNRVSWRNSSAIQDGDLAGGYYDAGDYIKCTFPLSFSLMSVCWGAIDYGQGYDMANQTAYLDDMLRWGLDWLIKAHPNDNTLYVQVADGDLDNAYWGGDLSIPYPRPAYQINATHPGTDAAAQAAAAFAMCSNLYANRTLGSSYSVPASLQNTTYASTLLTHAEQLYGFATNTSAHKQQTYQAAVPETAYPSTSYGDDLAIAALTLAWATNSSDLFSAAQGYYDQYDIATNDSVFNWDAKAPGVNVLAAQLAHANSMFSANASAWQSRAEAYFDHIIGNQDTTNGGLLWWDGDSDDASLNPALNFAMLLQRYVPLGSSYSKQASYLDFAQRQVNYVLGSNPMHVPYIVGVNPNSPSNPHSAAASGGDNISAIDTDPAQEAYVLYGAVIGGPDKQDRYFDRRSDWVETEVALDYNAPMLTLVAMHVANDTTDPVYTSIQDGAYDSVKPTGSPCDAAIPCATTGHLSTGAKVAIAVCTSLAGLVILGMALYWFILATKNQRGSKAPASS